MGLNNKPTPRPKTAQERYQGNLNKEIKKWQTDLQKTFPDYAKNKAKKLTTVAMIFAKIKRPKPGVVGDDIKKNFKWKDLCHDLIDRVVPVSNIKKMTVSVSYDSEDNPRDKSLLIGITLSNNVKKVLNATLHHDSKRVEKRKLNQDTWELDNIVHSGGTWEQKMKRVRSRFTLQEVRNINNEIAFQALATRKMGHLLLLQFMFEKRGITKAEAAAQIAITRKYKISTYVGFGGVNMGISQKITKAQAQKILRENPNFPSRVQNYLKKMISTLKK